MSQPARGSLWGWACRSAQFLSGICLLLAAAASVRESKTDETAASMRAAGATAYVAKTSAPEQLLAAIRGCPAE